MAALLTAVIPLALDGESATEAGGDGTAIAIVSVVSIVFAYVLLFVLWRYVFSPKARARRNDRGRSD
ncbi:MAG TPA: hypothetical protein VGN08_03520 [Solirubrobacteraceae bacterium]|jgi:hypothetical protein